MRKRDSEGNLSSLDDFVPSFDASSGGLLSRSLDSSTSSTSSTKSTSKKSKDPKREARLLKNRASSEARRRNQLAYVKSIHREIEDAEAHAVHLRASATDAGVSDLLSSLPASSNSLRPEEEEALLDDSALFSAQTPTTHSMRLGIRADGPSTEDVRREVEARVSSWKRERWEMGAAGTAGESARTFLRLPENPPSRASAYAACSHGTATFDALVRRGPRAAQVLVLRATKRDHRARRGESSPPRARPPARVQAHRVARGFGRRFLSLRRGRRGGGPSFVSRFGAGREFSIDDELSGSRAGSRRRCSEPCGGVRPRITHRGRFRFFDARRCVSRVFRLRALEFSASQRHEQGLQSGAQRGSVRFALFGPQRRSLGSAMIPSEVRGSAVLLSMLKNKRTIHNSLQTQKMMAKEGREAR